MPVIASVALALKVNALPSFTEEALLTTFIVTGGSVTVNPCVRIVLPSKVTVRVKFSGPSKIPSNIGVTLKLPSLEALIVPLPLTALKSAVVPFILQLNVPLVVVPLVSSIIKVLVTSSTILE